MTWALGQLPTTSESRPRCGCVCQADPLRRHGPYIQRTRSVADGDDLVGATTIYLNTMGYSGIHARAEDGPALVPAVRPNP